MEVGSISDLKVEGSVRVHASIHGESGASIFHESDIKTKTAYVRQVLLDDGLVACILGVVHL